MSAASYPTLHKTQAPALSEVEGDGAPRCIAGVGEIKGWPPAVTGRNIKLILKGGILERTKLAIYANAKNRLTLVEPTRCVNASGPYLGN